MRINRSLITFLPETGAGSGTVTSVAMTVPSIFFVLGTPITTAGTFQVGLVNQLANTFWAGPMSGAEDVPTFRLLVSDDIPNLDISKIEGPSNSYSFALLVISNAETYLLGRIKVPQLDKPVKDGDNYNFITNTGYESDSASG